MHDLLVVGALLLMVLLPSIVTMKLGFPENEET